MPNVGDNITFAWQYQKGGVNTIPAVPPTGIIIPPGGSATAFIPTAIDSVNVPGAYEYVVANSIQGTYLTWAETTDLTVDEPHIPNSITVDAVQGGSPSAIAAAVWNYVATNAVTTLQALVAIYERTTGGGVTVATLTSLAQTEFGEFIPGNDYYAADGSRGLTITTPYPQIPLTNCTVVYKGRQRGQTVSFQVIGTVLNATQVNFDFPANITAIMQEGFASVEQTLVNGHVITIAFGQQQIQIVQGL